jgi:hypothetical protein
MEGHKVRKLVLQMGCLAGCNVARPGRFGAGGWGDGLPLFAGLSAPFNLDLIEAQAYADGAVLHVYRPAAAGGRAPI